MPFLLSYRDDKMDGRISMIMVIVKGVGRIKETERIKRMVGFICNATIFYNLLILKRFFFANIEYFL